MTSMDRAFVKAFARRTRSATRATTGASTETNSDRILRTDHVAGDPRVQRDSVVPHQGDPPAGSMSENRESSNSGTAKLEPGALQVDPAVARTAQVWIDPIEDQISRADMHAHVVPTPHVNVHVDATDGVIASEPRNTEPGTESQSDQQVESADHDHASAVVAVTETIVSETEDDISDQLLRLYAQAVTDTVALPSVDPNRIGDPVSQVSPVTEGNARTDAEAESTQIDHDLPRLNETHVSDSVEPHATEESHVDRPGVVDADVDYANRLSSLAPTQLPTVDRVEQRTSEQKRLRVDPPSDVARMHEVKPMSAVWEVDVLDVPTTVADLFFDGALFQQIADRMTDAASNGLKTVLVTSHAGGEGRSTVAIGMAMASAAGGLRVALVDGDVEHPTLADDLRLDIRTGWIDAIRAGLPVKESAIFAVEDGVTLIPLMPPHSGAAASDAETAQLIQMLKNRFDLVIIDGPTDDSDVIASCAPLIDSAILVRDVQRTDLETVAAVAQRLQQLGVQGVGTVENFC